MQNLILILGLILCVQSLSGCSDTNTQPLDIKRFEIDLTKLDSFKDAENRIKNAKKIVFTGTPVKITKKDNIIVVEFKILPVSDIKATVPNDGKSFDPFCVTAKEAN